MGRVIDIPTLRCTACDAKLYGLKDLDQEIPMVTQKWAYTATIRYMPSKNKEVNQFIK